MLGGKRSPHVVPMLGFSILLNSGTKKPEPSKIKPKSTGYTRFNSSLGKTAFKIEFPEKLLSLKPL